MDQGLELVRRSLRGGGQGSTGERREGEGGALGHPLNPWGEVDRGISYLLLQIFFPTKTSTK